MVQINKEQMMDGCLHVYAPVETQYRSVYHMCIMCDKELIQEGEDDGKRSN